MSDLNELLKAVIINREEDGLSKGGMTSAKYPGIRFTGDYTGDL